MKLRWRYGVGVLVGLCAGGGVCAAQSSLPAAYVQVGPTLIVHTEGQQYHRASPALTGTTLGAVVAVGARFTPELGVEAAIAADRTLSGRQSDVYFVSTDYTAESRDVAIDVNLRFRPRGGSHLEFTAGGGWAYTRFARRDVVFTTSFPPTTTRGVDTETSTWEPTLNGAMAVAMPLSRRVELVPSVGVRWIRRPFDSEAWYFGVGRYAVHVGLTLRFRS